MTKKRPKPRPDVLCGAPRSSDRRRHAHSTCSRPKSAILCLFRENSKCVYTVNVKIRLKATIDFSTFESRPPFPRRCAPGRAPRASQGTAAARRKFSANMKIEPIFLTVQKTECKSPPRGSLRVGHAAVYVTLRMTVCSQQRGRLVAATMEGRRRSMVIALDRCHQSKEREGEERQRQRTCNGVAGLFPSAVVRPLGLARRASVV